MWIAGVVLVLVIGAVLNLAIGWDARAQPSPPLWDIPALSGMYTGVVGMLAGFSVAAAIFLASLGPVDDTASFEAVVGTLLICFLILIATAMMYATTPGFPRSADEPGVTLQSLVNVVTSGVYFLGLSVSWFALPPLLDLIGLTTVGEGFIWLLFAVAVYECARLGLIAFRLTLARSQACLAIPLLGIGLTAAYWFLGTRAWPALWPSGDIVLRFGYVAFAVAFAGFVMQTGILLIHGNAGASRWFSQHGHRVGIAYLQVVSIVVLLAWFAVAMR